MASEVELRLVWCVLVGILAGACKGSDPVPVPPENLRCSAPERATGGGRFAFEERYGSHGFEDSIALTSSAGAPGWWFLAQQDGRVFRFAEDGAGTPELILDLRDQASSGFEAGLLGLAIHPDFANNGQIFVNYTNDDAGLETRISRFVTTDGGATFGDEAIVFRVDQPYPNHNAGHLAFGPDGFLYFGLGDGGSSGDPLNSGQDLQSHLGKLLRIDVDSGAPYSIPSDNPLVAGGGLPEIYAWGLRNPWRFSFDSGTGDLWLGDVGQDNWEEVNRIERGGNYGWRITEGTDCFDPPTDCDRAGLIEPEAVYGNTDTASVVGGVVYRGTRIPALVGTYLFSDFYTADVYSLNNGNLQQVTQAPGPVSHWEEGPDGEVWALTYDGAIYTLVPSGEGESGGPAKLLSQTGCVVPSSPSEPGEDLVAFDVAHPFWSDEASKRRWLSVPPGESITVESDGDWTLPIGTVLIKEFTREGQRIETRLMVRHADGGWAGYSYRWRPDGSDADLLPAGVTVDVGGPWTIPSRSGCMQCHTEAAGGSLSLESGQLGAQAQTLAAQGLLEGATGTSTWPDGARTWLHVNCSSCHRPDGGSRTDLDFRRTASLAELGVCEEPVHGDLGVPGAAVIRPGDPDGSVLWLRMSRRDANQMPPLGSHIVDEEGSELLRDWISALTTCP